ncbi:MAG: hypothetical protein ACRC7S_18550 [Cetobacterium sp.]
MSKKIQVMKITDYFKIVNPEYIYLKITPTTNTRNHKTDKFENIINKLYKDISKRIEKYDKTLMYQCKVKISYYVFIEKGGEIGFYFVIPEPYRNQFKDKINSTWNGVAINEVDKSEVPQFEDNCSKFIIGYTREDGLSLNVNKSSNYLIDSNMNMIDIMEDGDKIGIFYNFQPTSWYEQRVFGNKYKETMGKLKDLKPVDKDKGTAEYYVKSIFKTIFSIVNGVFSGLNLNGDSKSKEDNFSQTELILLKMMGKTYDKTSESTVKKGNSKVVKTQAVILSQSENKKREKINVETMLNSFNNAVGEDNRLKITKMKTKGFDMERYSIADDKKTMFNSDLEISNFIALPSKDTLNEKGISCINIKENPVPEELRQGIVKLGKSPYRGEKHDAFISNDVQLGNLPIGMIGQQGSGKTTAMENMAVDTHKAKESNVIIDIIKECELSDNIARNIPKEDTIIIDLSTPEGIQGFGYNEVQYDEDMQPMERMKIANKVTQQVVNLVDAINDCGDPLSPRMRRFLNSACFLTFIYPNQALSNVIEVLEDFRVREEYISNIPEDMKSYMKSKLNALYELDERDKKGYITGTSTSKIEGILDRVNLLREDFMLELMFDKSTENNIDFVKAIDEGKTILIKVPESEFGTKYSKNVLVTFFLSKVWLASQLRKVDKDSTKVNVFIDEIFQSPQSMKLCKTILPQSRKFKVRMILSFHYFKQIKEMEEALKAAGCSFMLLQGTEKENFEDLKKEFTNLGYDVDSLLNLKRYHSLNLIKVNNGYSAFITELPKPVKNKIELQNVIEVDFNKAS